MALVEISWLGHACFRLRGREVTVLTDPFSSDGWAYPPLNASADVVTVSHDHPHHSSLEGVAGSPRVLRGPGEYEIGGAMVWGVRTHRKDGSDPPRGRNVAFMVQIEGLTICHLGDIGAPLTADQLTQLQGSDVLLVPVGGHCTVGAAEAAALVAQVEPRIVVPMHFATPETQGHLELDSAERFCKEMGATSLVPQTRLSVTAGSLPDEPTVHLLEPRR